MSCIRGNCSLSPGFVFATPTIFAVLAVTLSLCAGNCWAAETHDRQVVPQNNQNNRIKDRYKPRYIDVGVTPPVLWCGTTRKLIWASPDAGSDTGGVKGRGIRIGDVDTLLVTPLTTNFHHVNPSCASNGLLVFYQEETPDGPSGLIYTELQSNRSGVVFDFDRAIPPVFYPLSPDGSVIVGPVSAMKNVDIGGASVSVLPLFKRGNDGLPQYYHLGWLSDNRMNLLLDYSENKVSLQDRLGGRKREIQMNNLVGTMFRISRDGGSLYFVAETEHAGVSRSRDLYVVDIEKTTLPRLIIKDIGTYDVGSNNQIVYSMISKKGLFLKKPRTKEVSYLTDNFDSFPSFSPDGNSIVFIRGLSNTNSDLNARRAARIYVIDLTQ